MERDIGWYSASTAGTKSPTGGMTWAETDRSWMKAKGRSLRTVLDSVDLMKNHERSRRRRKTGAAIAVVVFGVGLAALMAFAAGSGGSIDGPALASDEEQAEDANESTGTTAALEIDGQGVADGAGGTNGNTGVRLAISTTGGGIPGIGSGGPSTGGPNVFNPTNPSVPQPPVGTGGGGGNGGGGNGGNGNGGNGGGGTGGGGGNGGGGDGDDSPIDASLGLGDVLGGGGLLGGSGAVEGLFSIDGEASGDGAGDLGLDGILPENDILPGSNGGNLLDVEVDGDPENTDDPLDAEADVNAGDTDANVNDDNLSGDLLDGLLD